MPVDESRAGFLRALLHGHGDREPQPPPFVLMIDFAPIATLRKQAGPLQPQQATSASAADDLVPAAEIA